MSVVNGPNSVERQPRFVRNIALLPGETVSHVFSPDLGLTQDPPGNGQVLVATNCRILAFRRSEGRNETFLAPLEELRVVALQAHSRSLLSMLQGFFLLLVGIFLYLAVAYWITGRIPGPAVPGINMDLAPLLMLLLGVMVVVVMGRRYLIKEEGSVSFRGGDWRFEFPYRGERAGRDLYEMLNSVLASRLSGNSRPYLWED